MSMGRSRIPSGMVTGLAFNRAFGEAGLDWDWSVDLYGPIVEVTGGKERIQYFLDEFNRSFRRPEDLNGFIADLHRSKTRHYMSMMAEGHPLRPGYAVCSRRPARPVSASLSPRPRHRKMSRIDRQHIAGRAAGWFEVIGAGDIVERKKPAPDIYSWVLQQMGLKPRRSWHSRIRRTG